MLNGLKMPGLPAGGASGAEMMLRSLGLGEMIDVVKQMAESGVVDNIIKFSEGIGELNERLARIELAIDRLEQRREHGQRQSNVTALLDIPPTFLGGGDERIPGAGVEPDLGSAAGRNPELRDVELSGGSASGGSSGAGDARPSDGARGSRRSRTALSGGGKE